MKRILLAVFVGSLFSATQVAIAATEPQAATQQSQHAPKRHKRIVLSPNTSKKDGWWIKVNRDKQESPTITFFIGSNNHSAEYWMTWDSGDSLEFDVPSQFRNINPLYIKAQSSRGRNTWFCMMYKGAGVKHFDFDDDEDHEEKQSDHDDECK